MSDLGIPFLTLLDFDLGRHGGGPLRLKYAYEQLAQRGKIDVPEWVCGDPTTAAYWRSYKKVSSELWREWLQECGVHFSFPLDLDMMMLRAFPDAYGVHNAEVPEDEEKLNALRASVFGQGDGLEAYEEKAQKEDYPSDEELVTYLKIAEKTAYRFASEGRLPGFKVGGSWRLKKEEIDAWIKQQSLGNKEKKGVL